MKTPNPIALTAAVIATTISLFAFSSNIPKSFPTEINGAKVFNLDPVVVHPSAEDLRAAAMLSEVANLDAMYSPLAQIALGASQISAQVSMPYYSFASAKSVGIKE